MKLPERSKPSLLLFALLLSLSACTAAPPVCPEPPAKAEPPPALMVEPSDQALRALFAILGVPWPTSGESTSPTQPGSGR